MEENNKEQQTVNKTNGAFAIGGIFLIGYIIGCAQASKAVNESYKRGVADTLSAIIFKQQ